MMLATLWTHASRLLAAVLPLPAAALQQNGTPFTTSFVHWNTQAWFSNFLHYAGHGGCHNMLVLVIHVPQEGQQADTFGLHVC